MNLNSGDSFLSFLSSDHKVVDKFRILPIYPLKQMVGGKEKAEAGLASGWGCEMMMKWK